MTVAARALIRDNQAGQARIGAVTTLLLLKLGEQLHVGNIGTAEFLAAFTAAEKLGHDQAAHGMAQFLQRFRALLTPGQAHAEPVLDPFDAGASLARAAVTVRDLDQLGRTQADYDTEFSRIIRSAAAAGFRHVLNGGRDTLTASAAANRTRWRRITSPGACAFCVLLASTDYRTEESALTVVGRASGYGSANYRATGEVTYTGRLRGTRPLGETYHDHCACTVVEVLTGLQPTAIERAQRDLYERAVEKCQADGVRASTKNVLAAMREIDDGTVVRDAHVSRDAQAPETEAGGSGGGKRPPPQGRVPGPDESPEDHFRRAKPKVTDRLRTHILDGDKSGGGHRFTTLRAGKTVFPEDWDDERIIRAINQVIKDPRLVQHRGPFFVALGEVDRVRIEVRLKISTDELQTAHPIDGDGVARTKLVNGELQRRPVPYGKVPVIDW